MKNLTLLDHPVLKHKLGQLRDKQTAPAEFRLLIKEITQFLVYEATRDLVTTTAVVETPLMKTKVSIVEDYPIAVSIMRAGNGMLEAINSILPESKSGHIGIYRNNASQNTIEYYLNLPEGVEGKTALLVDPLIATADTVIASINRLKEFGINDIKCLVILTSKEGLARVSETHPDVSFYALEVNEDLDDNGYLLPGLGDVGDRFYNTK